MTRKILIQTTTLLLIAQLSIPAVFAAQTAQIAQTTPSDTVKELHYPPIRIEAPESRLDPKLKKDKAELVDQSQVLEDIFHRAGAVYSDPALEKAVADLIPPEQLGPEANGFYFRVYILKDPAINAVTTPSGSIYVNSGLLAMLDNFEELRAVMAHESHHAIGQDAVYEYQRVKDETTAFKVLSILAIPAVAYGISRSDSGTARTIADTYTGVSWIAGISYQLSLFGYGRGRENDADLFAMEVLDKYGHDAYEVHDLFDKFDKENDKYNKAFIQTHLFASHETAKERRDRVDQFLKAHGYPMTHDAPPVDRRYQELTRDIRIENAHLNIDTGRVQHAIDDLERLRVFFPDDARILSALGDAYSKIAEDRTVLQDELSRKEWSKIRTEKEEIQKAAWTDKAMDFYRRAIAADAAFADPYRGEALLHEAQKAYGEALPLFEKYIELSPSAKDAHFVRAKIKRMKNLMEKAKEIEANKGEKK